MDRFNFLPAPPLPQSDWALFLDIDGTLLDFASGPLSVTVPPSLPTILQRLSARMAGACALVSGRALPEIDQVMGLPHFPAAGQHGLEWRLGEINRTINADDTALANAESALQAFADQRPGIGVERKRLGLVLHLRNVPHYRDEAAALATQLAEQSAGRLVLQAGNHVYELRQPGGDKGQAVMRFMACAPFSGRMPVFVGDDLTDEHAFQAVNMLGGLSILVGQRAPTHATLHLPDPAAVRHWLAQADAALNTAPLPIHQELRAS